MSRERRAYRDASKLWALLVKRVHEALGRALAMAQAQAETLLTMQEDVPFGSWGRSWRLPLSTGCQSGTLSSHVTWDFQG
jgi:hypothetical protein